PPKPFDTIGSPFDQNPSVTSVTETQSMPPLVAGPAPAKRPRYGTLTLLPPSRVNVTREPVTSTLQSSRAKREVNGGNGPTTAPVSSISSASTRFVVRTT